MESSRAPEGVADSEMRDANCPSQIVAIGMLFLLCPRRRFPSISLAEVVYLVEKNRLPSSAYDDLTQAHTDPGSPKSFAGVRDIEAFLCNATFLMRGHFVSLKLPELRQ